jgi:HEAT repeat protein
MGREQIDELFAQTLTGDFDDQAPWDAVQSLHNIGGREVFDRAAAWCSSDDPLKRARGAAVLGQLGKSADHPENQFPEECFSAIAPLVQQVKDSLPLMSAIHALGHIRNPQAIPLVIEHRLHTNADVRFAVACTLGSFADDPSVVDTLLELMQDSDDDVRDWATFGLGVQGELNTQEIRDALWQRVSDSDLDVREEALVGLGKRKDQRALIPLIAALNQPEVSYRVIEAAEAFLRELEQTPNRSPDDYIAALIKRLSL